MHFLYEKANNFLNVGPRWQIERLPAHWMDTILLSPPTVHENESQETQWLLNVLVAGLRNQEVSRGRRSACHRDD